jgi:hypothetical protein
MVVRTAAGGTCFALRWGVNGGGETGCPQGPWTGPPLAQLAFDELSVRRPGPAVFIAGRVRPDVARIVVHLPDGRTLPIAPVEGFVLTALPPRYAGRAHHGAYAVAFDRSGRQVARARLGGA